MTDKEPTPENIKQARLQARLSQRGAAALVYISRRSWQTYEDGTSSIKMGLWELFLLKTGQMWLKPATAPQTPRPLRRGRPENLKPYMATQ